MSANPNSAWQHGSTGYRLPDGTMRYLRNTEILDALNEACDGIDTPRARLLLTATGATSGRMHELAQSLRPEPASTHQEDCEVER
jgi:hypothetical protein